MKMKCTGIFKDIVLFHVTFSFKIGLNSTILIRREYRILSRTNAIKKIEIMVRFNDYPPSPPLNLNINRIFKKQIHKEMKLKQQCFKKKHK